MPWMFWRRNRSEAALSEQEHQLREREAEQAEALAALEISRKTLEGAAAFVQVRWLLASRASAPACLSDTRPVIFSSSTILWLAVVFSVNAVAAATSAATVAKSLIFSSGPVRQAWCPRMGGGFFLAKIACFELR